MNLLLIDAPPYLSFDVTICVQVGHQKCLTSSKTTKEYQLKGRFWIVIEKTANPTTHPKPSNNQWSGAIDLHQTEEVQAVSLHDSGKDGFSFMGQ